MVHSKRKILVQRRLNQHHVPSMAFWNVTFKILIQEHFLVVVAVVKKVADVVCSVTQMLLRDGHLPHLNALNLLLVIDWLSELAEKTRLRLACSIVLLDLLEVGCFWRQDWV